MEAERTFRMKWHEGNTIGIKAAGATRAGAPAIPRLTKTIAYEN